MKAQLILLQLAVSSLGFASNIIHRQSAAPIPPSQDPFYRPDAGFESKLLGTILRSRKLDQAWATSNATYQLLLRSTDSNGQPSAVVTTILEPEAGDPKKLIASIVTSDSPDVDCSQSYLLQAGAGQGAMSPSSNFFLTSALAEGWYVTVPDYLGPDAAFSNGLQEGQAVLDSLRAALASADITGLDPDATIGMSGYSGGAVAGEFATELQSCYAPEVKIAGAALGGLVPNITATYEFVNNKSSAGLLPAGLLGLSAQNKEFRTHLESLLFPQNASVFNYSLTNCPSAKGIAFFANQDIDSFFTIGANIIHDPMVTEFATEFGIMGLRGTPKVPFYAYKGVLDEVSNITDTDNLVDEYCAAGANIRYVRNEGIDHEDEQLVGQDGAWSWLKDRVNGVPISAGCAITTVSQAESTMPPSSSSAS